MMSIISSSSSLSPSSLKDDEYKELVSSAFNSCLPYINELYPNLVNISSTIGLLQQRTLIKTILAVATNIIDEITCIKIDKLLKFELNDAGIFDLDSIPPFGKVKQTIISVWQGSIVRLEVDAIVNAVSNPYCLGCNIPLHNCIDNTIHSFAGPRLRNESKFLSKTSDAWKKPINISECRVTKAHCLPCKYVIHTKGPTCQEPCEKDKQQLANCYINILNIVKSMGLRSVAFCCISTGLHSFEPELSSRIAIDTVKSYLEKIENLNCFDAIIFAVSTSKEFKSYMNNQSILLTKNSSSISIINEQLPKKKIVLPLSALKGLHYPWIISDESEKIESLKESDMNNGIDLQKLNLLTSIEGAREHFLNNNKLSVESTWKEIEDDSEVDLPDFDKLNLLKLDPSLGLCNSRSDDHTVLGSDSKDVMNDAMDTKYDWILLTLNSGSRMQQAILNDLSSNISDSDSNEEAGYLKKLSNIYKPDLSVMQYIIGCTKLSTKLSSIWRGYQMKQKLRMAISSIRLIQRVYKRYYVREKLIKCRIELRMLRFKSIIKIQSVWRKYICRQKFLKMYIELSIHKSVQNYALVKISSLYRGYKVRKSTLIYLHAIIALQSYFRMKNFRRMYHKNMKSINALNPFKLKLKEKWRRARAASIIQRNWMMFKHRWSYLIKLELLNIHRRIRYIYLPQKSFQRIINLVKRMQISFRKRRDERLFGAAIVVYLFIKTRFLRRRFLKIRAALPVLEKVKRLYRVRNERKKYLATMQAMYNIKDIFSEYIARNKTITNLKELVSVMQSIRRCKATVKMQTVWRKYICRQKFLKCVALSIHKSIENIVIVKISSLFRGYCVRKNIDVYLYAIIALQSYFRVKYCRNRYEKKLRAIKVLNSLKFKIREKWRRARAAIEIEATKKIKAMFHKYIATKKAIANIKKFQSIIRGNKVRKDLSSYYLNQILVGDSNKSKIFARASKPASIKSPLNSPFRSHDVSMLIDENKTFLDQQDETPFDDKRRSISPSEMGTPIRTSNLISLVFGNDSDSSSIYSQPVDSPLDIAKNKIKQPINTKNDGVDVDDHSSDEFNLKQSTGDEETDTDDSFDNNRKPGSAILSYESNPDLDNFKDFKYYDAPMSPQDTSLKGTLYKGSISSILKDKYHLESSSDSTLDRQLITPGVKWAPNVKFNDTEEKKGKEPSEIMYTENPLQSLHAVYTVPINVIGGIGSAIGGTLSGWVSTSPPSDPILTTEYTPLKNTNPTTDELIEERRKKKAMDDDRDEGIQLTESYDLSPLMTPSGYQKTPVIESSSDSFTAAAILRTLFIDPTQFAWSTAGKETDMQSKTNEEVEFAFENIYGEAEPTKLDFMDENNDHLDFQYENSGIILESLKKREEEEQIVYQRSNSNIEVEKSEDQAALPLLSKTKVDVENYHPKRKTVNKPFSDTVLKRKINLRLSKSDDVLKTHIPPEPLTSVGHSLSTPSINLKPNPNPSPDDFDFQYVHMYPSPVISMKMNLAQEIASKNVISSTLASSTTNHHHNILDAIKPKTFPIMQHRNIGKRSSLNSNTDANKNSINLDDWETRSTSIHDDNSHYTNTDVNTKNSQVENTTDTNIKEYLEIKELSEIDDILSKENSEVYEFQHKLSNMEIATNPISPVSVIKTPPNTPTISSAPSAIKILSSITAWMIPFEDGDEAEAFTQSAAEMKCLTFITASIFKIIRRR